MCVKADCFLKFSTDFSSFPDDDMPIQSKGGYHLDFDNLDNINPFQGSNKMILSPPRPTVENCSTHRTESDDIKSASVSEETSKIDTALDETLPFTPSVENSLADLSANASSTESSVVSVAKAVAPDSFSVAPDEEQCAAMSPNADEDQVSGTFVEDALLPAKASYTLDFDKLDAINPFQTGGSKIPNSPVLGQNNNPSPKEVTEYETLDVIDLPSAPLEAPVQPGNKPVAEPQISANPQSTAMESQPSDVPVKGGPLKLEFSFDDGSDGGRKPQTKKIGKRPSSVNSKAEKPPSDNKPAKEIPVNPDNAEVDIPAPKGSYSFSFDKFDDPNFNPFGTNSNVNNSPKCSTKSTSVVADDPVAEKMETVVEKEAASPTWCVFSCVSTFYFPKICLATLYGMDYCIFFL